MLYRLTLRDKKGKIVKDTGLLRSHSYVIQFLEMMQAFCDGINMDATDTAGGESRIVTTTTLITSHARADAGIGNDDYGILVGSNAGATPEGNTDYALDTKIVEGTGAGQLEYQAVTFVNARVVGANVDLDVSRPFINNSGAGVVVREIGLVVNSPGNYHMLLRDVVSDFTVTDGYTLTVVYTLRTTA